MNDGLTISFPADDSTDDRRTKVAAMAEGVVQVNMAEFEAGATMPEHLRYEPPRKGARGQRIGSLRECARRGLATCIEIACIVCAAERLQGSSCYVQIISTKYREKVRPYVYHAIVRYSDGTVFDACELLDGYDAHGEWWARPGHCCASCAVDEPCQGDCSCGGKH